MKGRCLGVNIVSTQEKEGKWGGRYSQPNPIFLGNLSSFPGAKCLEEIGYTMSFLISSGLSN